MGYFEARSLAILGRLPNLSLAELERLYGARHIQPLDTAALLDVEVGEINFSRLGGTIKLGKVLATLPFTDWPSLEKFLLENVPERIEHLEGGKFTLGLSAYGYDIRADKIYSLAIRLKKAVQTSGRSARIVPNKSAALGSAQVLHNRLTSRGGWELLLVKNGKNTILAQTFFVQDIEAYAARDQARPARDARVGMLPPKLAQIIINLANPPTTGMILDPFCGTGVTMQEALLMGYETLGSDIAPKMIGYSKTNLDWLANKYQISEARYRLAVGDACNYVWPGDISAVASETYLGRPLASLPPPDKLQSIIRDVNTILEKFLKNLNRQLKPGTPLSLAIPAWIGANDKIIRLPLVDHLTDMGYNYLELEHVRREDLLYYRSGQVVARQLVIMRKV